MEWKWTYGEPCIRTKRQYNSKPKTKSNYISDNDNFINDAKDDKFNKEIEQSAYTTSLNHDENTWDILNTIQSQNQGNNSNEFDFRQVNKREDTDKKLAEREMICQVSMNPYLTTNNYLDDVVNRDTFLKPQATNWDREKKKEESN
jgi:hypothetical protein